MCPGFVLALEALARLPVLPVVAARGNLVPTRLVDALDREVDRSGRGHPGCVPVVPAISGVVAALRQGLTHEDGLRCAIRAANRTYASRPVVAGEEAGGEVGAGDVSVTGTASEEVVARVAAAPAAQRVHPLVAHAAHVVGPCAVATVTHLRRPITRAHVGRDHVGAEFLAPTRLIVDLGHKPPVGATVTEVNPAVEGLLIDEGEQVNQMGSLFLGPPRMTLGPVKREDRDREHPEGVVIVVHRDAQLLQIVLALSSPGCFTGLLDSGQQQRDQNGDDRNHHQKFDQCEGAFSTSALSHASPPYQVTPMNSKNSKKRGHLSSTLAARTNKKGYAMRGRPENLRFRPDSLAILPV